MKKRLVLYYSKTGNSKFLAEKIARGLEADVMRVVPLFKSVLLLYLLSLMKLRVAINIRQEIFEKYDELILLGPIWGGLLISPLRSLLWKAVRSSKIIHFALSCETSDEKKDSKYGYAQVLREADALAPKLVKTTEAFSSALVDDKQVKPNLREKIKLSDSNFKGPIQARLDDFIARIKSA